ncbi:MAG: hypothetical protein ACPGQT_07435 [Rhodothermales bacterium]
MTKHDNMTQGKSPQDPDRIWADDRLEAWLAGELRQSEADRFEHILEDDAWLAREVDQARAMDVIFSELKDSAALERCPDIVTTHVVAHARREWLLQLPLRVHEGFRRMASAGLRPALAVALLFVVVISATWMARSPSGSANLTAGQTAEVTQALADVKMALAVLANAGQTTGTAVGADVIGPYVVRPMARGMNTVIEN